MEEIFIESVKELLKTGILGAIIAWLLTERYLRDIRSSSTHEELNETLHELVIILKSGRLP